MASIPHVDAEFFTILSSQKSPLPHYGFEGLGYLDSFLLTPVDRKGRRQLRLQAIRSRQAVVHVLSTLSGESATHAST